MILAEFTGRAPRPAFFDEDARAWMITRYADVSALLRRDDVYVLEQPTGLQRLSDRLDGAFRNLIFLFGPTHPVQNRPLHGPLRTWLSDFIAGIVQDWPPERMDGFVVGHLAMIEEGRPYDAVQLLARPLPTAILGSALGLQPQDVLECSQLARNLSTFWQLDNYPLRELRAMEEKAAAIGSILSRRHGTAPEQQARLGFLAFAGVATTVALIGNALDFLSRQPELQARLRHEPALMSGFLNETLRYWPPLRRTISRKSASTVTLSGVEIPAGALMSVDLDSAHHDAEAFENPNMFDPTRKGPPSLAFGLGAHACLGAVLARQEASVLLQRLLRNFVVCPAGQSRRMCDSDWCDFETIPITLVPVRS